MQLSPQYEDPSGAHWLVSSLTSYPLTHSKHAFSTGLSTSHPFKVHAANSESEPQVHSLQSLLNLLQNSKSPQVGIASHVPFTKKYPASHAKHSGIPSQKQNSLYIWSYSIQNTEWIRNNLTNLVQPNVSPSTHEQVLQPSE